MVVEVFPLCLEPERMFVAEGHQVATLAREGVRTRLAGAECRPNAHSDRREGWGIAQFGVRGERSQRCHFVRVTGSLVLMVMVALFAPGVVGANRTGTSSEVPGAITIGNVRT